MNIGNMSRVLTSKGYAILKTSITESELADIRTELTVRPNIPDKYTGGINATDTRFCIYQESISRIYVPRIWGIQKYGPPEADTVSGGLCFSSEISFIGKPFSYQETIIQSFIENGANGLICIPCGRGKTFIAIYLAILLGKRFLVVVDKEFLANQWKEEIQRFVKNIRVGIIQGGKMETDPSIFDCTICMIQTICQRDFKDQFFAEYGFTIFDECHHLGAQHFSIVLKKIHTRHMLGLSATPKRDDGLTKVFEYFLGPPVYQESREPDPTVCVRAIWFRSDDSEYTNLPTDWRGELVTARLMTQVINHMPRTARIIEVIREIVVDTRRKILVLSERRGHLEEIRNLLGNTYMSGFYIGGMKQDELSEVADKCQIILGTYAMASEAMNIKTLNAMIMASPRKKVEQSTGRILRVSADKRDVDPIIIDIIDQHEIYVRQWYQRLHYYKKCKYNIAHEGQKEKSDIINSNSELDNAIKNQCMIKMQ